MAKKNDVIVLSNGGKTFDRYTIILTKDGEMFGSSVNPFHPQGFGMYVGNVCTMRDRTLNRYYDHKKGEWPAWLVKNQLSMYLKDCENVGKPIKVSSLPADVQKYVAQLLITE